MGEVTVRATCISRTANAIVDILRSGAATINCVASPFTASKSDPVLAGHFPQSS